ncbi:hypothetical protein P4H94_03535 [Paenibacillus macerans]|uniref:Uncharacterized protein n=1 Tax=Paenibacillus macerans TaxID=44252 RepID=A0A6N8ETC8_PAEMA|nr:hypothetical protein [Paenibacillus macerans]MBS5909894.1 hypothetical protein [Paenibacillus macerans]MCY7562667.1 hypothetical protein [Paenibacillus macerans]MEC0135971.1 hypothetical protein [Paenibacillus macerans]MEC0149066.1 hypothetical protein [Paenibacillus macerans]MEC0331042.1 hypothetical protein [Paenibacillus macerans]
MQFGGGWPKTVKIQLDLKIRVDSWLLERQSVGIQNSGTLCAYYPESGMFILISGIFCTYFSMNGPEREDFLATRENNDINCLYFPQMDGNRRNNAIFYSCVFRWSIPGSLGLQVFL